MSEPDIRSEARADAEQQVDEEAMRAAEGLTVSEDVKESYQEATERGASQQGEGRVP
jgi:hypothetical protein